MRGPFLPIYGSGAILMYVVSRPFQDNIILTYIAGAVGATALEYVTGVTMEALFKVRYWDYSYRRFNFQGHICLHSTIAWGFFTILMTKVIHRPIESMVLSIPENVLAYITNIITVYVVADFTLSFKAALDIKDILIKMEKLKDELLHMQKRLDVYIAFNNEEKEQRKQEWEGYLGELTAGIKQRFGRLKDMIQSNPSAYGDSEKEEIAELRLKFGVYMENRKNTNNRLDFYKRDMIRNNPMTSERFKDAIEELKNGVDSKKGTGNSR